jgi:hypothetical protein
MLLQVFWVRRHRLASEMHRRSAHQSLASIIITMRHHFAPSSWHHAAHHLSP